MGLGQSNEPSISESWTTHKSLLYIRLTYVMVGKDHEET